VIAVDPAYGERRAGYLEFIGGSQGHGVAKRERNATETESVLETPVNAPPDPESWPLTPDEVQ